VCTTAGDKQSCYQFSHVFGICNHTLTDLYCGHVFVIVIIITVCTALLTSLQNKNSSALRCQ